MQRLASYHGRCAQQYVCVEKAGVQRVALHAEDVQVEGRVPENAHDNGFLHYLTLH